MENLFEITEEYINYWMNNFDKIESRTAVEKALGDILARLNSMQGFLEALPANSNLQSYLETFLKNFHNVS